MNKDALKISGYSFLILAFIGVIVLNIAFLKEKSQYQKFINKFIPTALENNIFEFPIKKNKIYLTLKQINKLLQFMLHLEFH